MTVNGKSFGYKALGPFYATTKAFGLLLVKEHAVQVPKLQTNDISDDVPYKVFVPDKRLWVYSALLLLYLYWTLRKCVQMITWPCSTMEDCSFMVEWIVSSASVAQAMASIMVASAYRFDDTAALLDRMLRLLAAKSRRLPVRFENGVRDGHKAALAYFVAVSAVTVIRVAAITLARPGKFVTVETVMCLPAILAPVVVECGIVRVCLLFDVVSGRIIRGLERLHRWHATDDRRYRSRQLKDLWEMHWQCCRLVDAASRCYGLDLLLNLTVCMMFFIVYAYTTLLSVYAIRLDKASEIFWNVGLVCQLVCVSIRVVFVSYQAEKLKRVAEDLVKISLRNVLASGDMNDISNIILINAFTNQIVNRNINLSACGFFSVNLSFIHGLIRLATTYLIVVIQYSSKAPK